MCKFPLFVVLCDQQSTNITDGRRGQSISTTFYHAHVALKINKICTVHWDSTSTLSTLPL